MKLASVIFVIITATLSARAFETEHHDHSGVPQLSKRFRSVHSYHPSPQDVDQTMSGRDDILLEFSTRELVEELEARMNDPHYDHMERREPGLRTWIQKQVSKLTGSGTHPPAAGGGYGATPGGGVVAGGMDTSMGAVDTTTSGMTGL